MRATLVFAVVASLFAGCGGSDEGSEVASDTTVVDDASSGDLVSGVGVITIDGFDYEFEVTECLEAFGDLLVGGFGTTDDGTVFYGAVTYLLNVRNDELLPPMMSADEIAAAIQVGDIDEDLSVIVDIGRADLLEETPDDAPSFRASRSFDNDVEGEVTAWTVEGDAITGSGSAIDQHGVAAASSTLLPTTFSARC